MSWKDELKKNGNNIRGRQGVKDKVPYVKNGIPHCCGKEMEFVEGKDGDGHRCVVCGGET